MSVVALVLGAGQGARLAHGIPKASVRVSGKSLLHWSAAALARSPRIDAVLPVIHASGVDEVATLRAAWRGPARLLDPTVGGATRQASVARGLEAVARQMPDAEWVLVHDAARCLVEPEDAEAVLDAARETGAALPVIPPGDTVKALAGDRVERTLDRSRLGLAQTPQAFRVSVLSEAIGKAEREGFTATDCASAVERLGVVVRVCAGRPENFKVTHPRDLERAEAILGALA